MKANRRARNDPPPRSLLQDDRGASEIVGYMIAFGISSVILVLSLTAFNAMRDYSGELVADRTVQEVGQRVSFAVDESLQSGANYPESEFSRTLRLPKEINHHTYTVELGRWNLWVNMTDADPTFKDEDGDDIDTQGRVNITLVPRANSQTLCTGGATEIKNGTCIAYSMDGEVTVKYARPDPASPMGVYLVRP